MSLPVSFHTSEEYFIASLNFFRQYEHLYKHPNTDILINNVLDQIDVNRNTDIFKTDFNIESIKESCRYIGDFLKGIDRLKFNYHPVMLEQDYEFNAPIKPKKKHEIFGLALELSTVCEEIGCSTIVDFGSGLGYLDQIIYEKYKYRVLGIDSKEHNYVSAKMRQRKHHPESIENVKFMKHFISGGSRCRIIEYLNDKFQDCDSFCITGLHACADLAVDSIDLFLNMPECKALVVMPCCYHKMDCDESKIYRNFPLSNILKKVCENIDVDGLLATPFLRLAAQPPDSRNEDLKDSVFNLLSRAVLQLYAVKNGLSIKRKKRKAVKVKTINNCFLKYAEDAIKDGFTFTKESEPFTTENESENSSPVSKLLNELNLLECWNKFSDVSTRQKVALYILLQREIQPVIENFVLYDRLVYLKERGVEKCEYRKILDQSISPRCLVLIACK